MTKHETSGDDNVNDNVDDDDEHDNNGNGDGDSDDIDQNEVVTVMLLPMMKKTVRSLKKFRKQSEMG